MSSFKRMTLNPMTDRYEMALWLNDYFGRHKYGVKFADGTVYNPEVIKLKTK